MVKKILTIAAALLDYGCKLVTYPEKERGDSSPINAAIRANKCSINQSARVDTVPYRSRRAG